MEQRQHNGGVEENKSKTEIFSCLAWVFLNTFFFFCSSLALVGCRYAEFKKTRFGSFLWLNTSFLVVSMCLG